MKFLYMLLGLSLMGCNQDQEINSLQEEFEYNPAEFDPLEPKWHTDRIHQVETPMANILVVVDNSISMDDDQKKLNQEMPYLINTIHDANLDYRIALLTTSWDNTFRKIGGKRWLDRSSPDPVSDFVEGVEALGLGGNPLEKGLYSLWLTMNNDLNKDFFRIESPLHIMVVTDEPDYTVVGDAGLEDGEYPDIEEFQDLYDTFDKHKRRAGNLTFTSVVMYHSNPCTGQWPIEIDPSRYLRMTDRYPGEEIDICSDDWSAGVEAMTDGIMDIRLDYHLSHIPIVDSVEVTVERLGVVQSYNQGSDWTYEPVINAIVFRHVVHDEHSVIVIDYQIAGTGDE